MNHSDIFSRASEKHCEDGRGHQHEEDTGTAGYGTVAQIPRTAVDEGACTAEAAGLGRDTFNVPQQNQRQTDHTLCTFFLRCCQWEKPTVDRCSDAAVTLHRASLRVAGDAWSTNVTP